MLSVRLAYLGDWLRAVSAAGLVPLALAICNRLLGG
ncbi:Hypothetical protein DSVG11_2705 [Desulfovibrio sp. G11]|nr:Hypothetical protein DSVG11_2705 [Desulfovibrio sp. G11]